MKLEKARAVADLTAVVIGIVDKIILRIDEKRGDKAKVKKLEEENAELKKKLGIKDEKESEEDEQEDQCND